VKKNPQLVAIRAALNSWNGRRDAIAGDQYATPAVVFFDRWIERAMRAAERPRLGKYWLENAGLDCAGCHLKSVDNLSTPTYKFEYAGEQLLALALRRKDVARRWLPHRDRLFLRAARATAKALTKNQGADATKWNESVEIGEFSAQGGISVPPLKPLPNRGSYAQLVEATGAPATR
jgi:acyl-homoserine lactone acylase PvdQ